MVIEGKSTLAHHNPKKGLERNHASCEAKVSRRKAKGCPHHQLRLSVSGRGDRCVPTER